jgi:hypothetical protein
LTEIISGPRAEAALEALFRRAEAFGGGAFRWAIDPCKTKTSQHVALAWNTKRVKNEALEAYGELNPNGGPCEGHLRPGFGGYFRAAGGLDLEIVGVHLKSFPDQRSFELRRSSWASLGAVRRRASGLRKDTDLVVIGDFNAMGCNECSPRVGPDAERAELARADTGLELLEVSPGCTHYYGQKPGLLDLGLVTRGMQELPKGVKLRAEGYCAERACRPLGGDVPAAHERLSDHCPIVLELTDRDLD